MKRTAVVDGLDWREVARYSDWGMADAMRSTTVHENPRLDVRLRSEWGAYILEVKGSPQ